MSYANARVDSDVCLICGQGARENVTGWLEKTYNEWAGIPKTPTGNLKIYAGHKYHVMCLDELNDQDYLRFPSSENYPGRLDGITTKNYRRAYQELQDDVPTIRRERAKTILQRIEALHFGLRSRIVGEEGANKDELRQHLYRALTERDGETTIHELKAMLCPVLAICVVAGGLVFSQAWGQFLMKIKQ
jgi:hypothetical protein